MHKKNAEPLEDVTTEARCVEAKSGVASIAWAITTGVLFGAVIGAFVGISLRPKAELTELSQEWLEEFRDVTDRVSGRVRKQVRDMVSKSLEPSGGYEEYPESYV